LAAWQDNICGGAHVTPFGTGLGTFLPVYATVEKDENVSFAFANRAHNDLAEVLLETGILVERI
jgi:hypothetical protein